MIVVLSVEILSIERCNAASVLIVDITGGFIKNENWCIFQHCARYCQTLTLPPESLCPSSPISVSQPSGSSSMKLVASAIRAACIISSSEALVDHRGCYLYRSRNRVVFCDTREIEPLSEDSLRSLTSFPSRLTEPCRGSWKRRDQQEWFSRPCTSNEANGLACSMLEIPLREPILFRDRKTRYYQS